MSEVHDSLNKATVCLIPYKNNASFRKILAEVKRVTDNIIVIDNNRESIFKGEVLGQRIQYAHNGNIGMLASATNMAVSLCETEYFIYLCSNHIHIYDDTWLEDLVEQMDNMPEKVVIGGDLIPYDKRFHIQGGVFIARTWFLKKYPYNAEENPFSYMDVKMSDKIIAKDYQMKSLKRVKSTMNKWNKFHDIKNIQDKRFKIVHGH